MGALIPREAASKHPRIEPEGEVSAVPEDEGEPGQAHHCGECGSLPAILWLGCSDSRVPESVITASPPGYIFVHRNIANQIHPDDDNALAVLTYAVGHIPSIEHIVVVGHTNYGGAQAALAAVTSSDPPPLEPVLQRWLSPLVELTRGFVIGTPYPEVLTLLIEESVRVQVHNVANSEPVHKAWVDKGRKNLWVSFATSSGPSESNFFLSSLIVRAPPKLPTAALLTWLRAT